MVYPGADQNGALCDYCPDSDDEDEDDVDEILEGTVHPLFFSCHGNILVSTSFCGCAICIWDTKTGELLKRYNNAEEERYTNLLPDGNDATDMTYLESLNAFLCMEWYIPTNFFAMTISHGTLASTHKPYSGLAMIESHGNF